MFLNRTFSIYNRPVVGIETFEQYQVKKVCNEVYKCKLKMYFQRLKVISDSTCCQLLTRSTRYLKYTFQRSIKR